jgi:hypothetical protein
MYLIEPFALLNAKPSLFPPQRSGRKKSGLVQSARFCIEGTAGLSKKEG